MQEFVAKLADLPLSARLAVLVGVAACAHMVVLLVVGLGRRVVARKTAPAFRKLRSIASLLTSAIVFSLYFLTFGFFLREFGINIKTYLASASILGLAIGFGSQGVVQDIVTGLTMIFSDLVDVGELVEVGGQTGVVTNIGMRFIQLENALGARVYVPNRSVTNVINYPKGYVRYIADVTLSPDSERSESMEAGVRKLVNSFYEQFPGILLSKPSVEGRRKTSSGKEYLRIKFRIWPNRGEPIEKTFRQEAVASLKKLDPDYQDWMIAINYETEERLPQPMPRIMWSRRPKGPK